MGFLDDLSRKNKTSDEEKKVREPGKTYRDGELKKNRPFRQTSVSSGVFTSTRILVSILVGAAVVGIVGYVGYYFLSLAMNW